MRRPYKKKVVKFQPPNQPDHKSQAVSSTHQVPPDNPIHDKVNQVIANRKCNQPIKRKAVPGVKYRPSVHPMVVSYLKRAGASDADVANELGISEAVVRRWVAVFPDFSNAMNTSRLEAIESVTKALLKAALGTTVTDRERVYEMRIHPVTRTPERHLVREKETRRSSLPNPIACFFYLQNRDSARWASQGQRGASQSPFTPEQIATLMRTGASAISDATIGVDFRESAIG